MAGGPVTSGGTYLVGERGPELFSPGRSGNITPNDKLGGKTTININNYSNAKIETQETEASNGDKTIDVMISEAVKREIKRGGFDSANRSSYGLTRVGY
jgi:phage-related minor tail protein